ncbi:hypothetical protein V6N11_005946 [Hibiscus sabdariffa]|uniref:Uncharacterized protein n=1 Tax=Hibiscus sabdariffa TaxID=183260 RepID=A0ABR2RP84_9ROSI
MMILVSLFLEQSVASELEEMVIDKPISYELWSRDEMIRLAGYGEEKLSTVLITGSVLCQACQHHHPHPQLRSWPISGFISSFSFFTDFVVPIFPQIIIPPRPSLNHALVPVNNANIA